MKKAWARPQLGEKGRTSKRKKKDKVVGMDDVHAAKGVDGIDELNSRRVMKGGKKSLLGPNIHWALLVEWA